MLSLRAGVISAVLGFTLVLPLFASAQNGYPGESLPCPNAHLATPQEASAASPKGSIIAGVTYVCPNDARLGINNEAGASKDYLRTILCPPDGDNYGGYGPDETIRRLDPKFAQCAATFLKSLNSSGNPYCIKEAARTVEKQNSYVARGVIACKKGAMCEHPRGIAIDINVTGRPGASCTEYLRAHQLAPQFGLTFYMGCKDAYHFVPQKGGCADANFIPSGTGASGVSTGGTSANGFLPASYYDYPQYAPSPTAPYMSAINALTPLLNNSMQQTSPTTPTSAGTKYDPNAYAQPSAPITLPTPSSSIFEVPPPYTVPLSTSTNTTTNTQQTMSYYDKLALFADGGQAGVPVKTGGTGTGTSAPTVLNNDLYDITTDTTTGGSNVLEDELPVIATNSVAINSVHVTETFTQPKQPTAVQSASSGVQKAQNQALIVALLTTLRDLLVTYLNFLKTHPTTGFQGAWQPKPLTGTFR